MRRPQRVLVISSIALSLAACTSVGVKEVLTPTPQLEASQPPKPLQGEWRLTYKRAQCSVFLLRIKLRSILHLSKRGCQNRSLRPIAGWSYGGQSLQLLDKQGKALFSLVKIDNRTYQDEASKLLLQKT